MKSCFTYIFHQVHLLLCAVTQVTYAYVYACVCSIVSAEHCWHMVHQSFFMLITFMSR